MRSARIQDRFEVRGVLGIGGEGTVVRAWDHQHGRYVALKIRSVTAQTDRRHILREASVLLRATAHPNLVVLRYDFFSGDEHVMVMDLVDGVSLADRLDGAAGAGLPPDEVVDALGDVAAALDHLHAHTPAIVHGDVKPANILTVIGANGPTSVLVDFGLASEGARLTGAAGTRGFAAPEVAHAATSAASDVYSLAATAHVLLAGVTPSPGVAGNWATLRPDTVAAVRGVLAGALAARPEARPASAGVFVEMLGRALRVGRFAHGTVSAKDLCRRRACPSARSKRLARR